MGCPVCWIAHFFDDFEPLLEINLCYLLKYICKFHIFCLILFIKRCITVLKRYDYGRGEDQI